MIFDRQQVADAADAELIAVRSAELLRACAARSCGSGKEPPPIDAVVDHRHPLAGKPVRRACSDRGAGTRPTGRGRASSKRQPAEPDSPPGLGSRDVRSEAVLAVDDALERHARRPAITASIAAQLRECTMSGWKRRMIFTSAGI